MAEWKTIDSAPKDGRRVILCKIQDGNYKEHPETFYFDHEWISVIDGSSTVHGYTHWMPLPNPPSEK